jgi:hypothetical protein
MSEKEDIAILQDLLLLSKDASQKLLRDCQGSLKVNELCCICASHTESAGGHAAWI